MRSVAVPMTAIYVSKHHCDHTEKLGHPSASGCITAVLAPSGHDSAQKRLCTDQKQWIIAVNLAFMSMFVKYRFARYSHKLQAAELRVGGES